MTYRQFLKPKKQSVRGEHIMKTSIVLLILTAGLSSLAAQSEERQRPQRPNPAEIFKAADTNEDGFVDLKELTTFRATIPQGRGGNRRGANAENATPPPRPEGQTGPGARGGRQMPSAEDMLASMDKNEDGKLAPEEFTMENRRGRGGPGGPGRGEGQRARSPE
jgi:hypothetical protein